MSKPITYIIREKAHKMILFQLPGQLDRKLSPKEVYADFDKKAMEMGWTEAAVSPLKFDISSNGEIVELQAEVPIALEEKPAVPPSIDTIEETTIPKIQSLIEDGTITIAANQKIVNNEIVEKTLVEQVAEGLIELNIDQKVEGERIVQKTAADLAKDGILTLNTPFEYLDDDQIAIRSVADALQEGLIQSKAHVQEGLRLIRESIENDISDLFTTSHELKLTKDYMDWITEGQPAKDKRAVAYREMQGKIEGVKQKYQATKEALKKELL